MDGFIMKKIDLMIGCSLLFAALLGCTALLAQQQALANKLIRFHVVADSNSAEDQAIKLLVRDALLEELAPLSAKAQSREEMLNLLQNSLSSVKETAEQVLAEQGSDDCVEVTLQPESFPTRYYDTFALPAGEYLSLRVRLGSAEGKNWWCVCFPTLCRSACTQDMKAVAAGAGFTDDEIEWMTDSDRYVIRFKLLEWIEALKG